MLFAEIAEVASNPWQWAELPQWADVINGVVRLLVAVLLGAVVGYDREQVGQAAGLRTHMLVALGSCLFVLTAFQAGSGTHEESRIIQGIAAGIGFIGAGTILKSTATGEIRGLTTAASIWLTAALGVAVGMGRLWLPIIAAVMAWFILAVLRTLEGKKPDPPSGAR